jgi:hypothetical protein
MRGERCERCGLPRGKFNVRLDREGICNYCRYWDCEASHILDYAVHQTRLEERLDRFKGKYDYDAVAGLSGGKDSTYVLYRLVKNHGLNVLTVTYDNGFLTEHAKKTVNDIVRNLGVEHSFYRPNWDTLKAFYRVSLRKYGDPCMACSVGGYSLALKACNERRIPFFIHGRSPSQMFKHFYARSRDYSINLTLDNLKPHSFTRLYKRYRKIDRLGRIFLYLLLRNRDERRRVYDEFFKPGPLRREFLPEFLGFFLFEPYDEEKIKRFLEERKIGYRRPENDGILGHADCLIHDACAYLYETKHGVGLTTLEAAAMRRQGKVTLEEAEEILARNTSEREAVQESIHHLLKKLDMTQRQFDAIVARLRRRGARSWA